MKIIFLDIEGVIVSHKSILLQTDVSKGMYYDSHSPDWNRFVDPLALNLIFKLSEDSGAKIVLTSTLRNDERIISALNIMWMRRNENAELIQDVTPNLFSREEEIQRVLSKVPVVERFVVIDDRQLSVENFVQTDPREGFSYKNYQICRRLLADDVNTLKPDLIFL